MNKPHPLVADWRREADRLERRGQANLATMARSFADELEGFEIRYGLETLSLTQAAVESGYSAAQIARMLESGRIENAGEKYAPRIRRKDLPRKPPKAPAPPSADGPDLVEELLSKQNRLNGEVG